MKFKDFHWIYKLFFFNSKNVTRQRDLKLSAITILILLFSKHNIFKILRQILNYYTLEIFQC